MKKITGIGIAIVASSVLGVIGIVVAHESVNQFLDTFPDAQCEVIDQDLPLEFKGNDSPPFDPPSESNASDDLQCKGTGCGVFDPVTRTGNGGAAWIPVQPFDVELPIIISKVLDKFCF